MLVEMLLIMTVENSLSDYRTDKEIMIGLVLFTKNRAKVVRN